MLLLSRDDIKKSVTMREMIESDKLAATMIVEDACEVPLRTKIPTDKGVFLFMPAYAEGLKAAALKVINIFPGNVERGLITGPAQVMLIDGETGYIVALLDGNTVTQMRTGAISGAAFDLLARKDARIGAVIGTGGQAPAQLEAMLAACNLETVRVYSRNKVRREAFAAEMNEELACYGASIVAAESADEAVKDADVVITVTVSETPVFNADMIKPGCVISAVGTYEPHKHELDPAILKRAGKIYCDSVDACLAETGDLLIPLGDGTIQESDITGNLGDLVLGKIPGRESDDEIIVFESVGFAALDLCAAKIIYDKAIEQGIGMQWE